MLQRLSAVHLTPVLGWQLDVDAKTSCFESTKNSSGLKDMVRLNASANSTSAFVVGGQMEAVSIPAPVMLVKLTRKGGAKALGMKPVAASSSRLKLCGVVYRQPPEVWQELADGHWA
mmetsp:Transcript_10012/g.22254  ORF Transcript_10012/g.22254 Transcript_10012/m.22254 type:complete len:117 (+) Transcript_10012:223-573(+)